MSHSLGEAQCSNHTVRMEPCLSSSPVQAGRYVWINLNMADGGHRGAGANTDYVDPQEGKVLPAAAPTAAA